MRNVRHRVAAVVGGVVWAIVAAGAAVAEVTPAQEDALAVWTARADALRHLTARVWAAHVTPDKTVAETLDPGGEGEIVVREALRAARQVGQPRRYSDGVTEVDLEIATSAVVQAVSDACTGGDRAKVWLEDLKAQGEEGFLRESGSARAPAGGADPDLAAAAQVAAPGAVTALYPIGWEHVTAAGRVEAERAARVRAYEAMGAKIRSLTLRPAGTVGQKVAGNAAAEGRLDGFVRSLAVAGSPRLMSDQMAEVTVTASVRELIGVLKEIRVLLPEEGRWRDEDIDQLSVFLKTDRLEAVGRGRPGAASVQPAEVETPAEGAPIPDWAARVIEATGAAALSEEVADPERARVLAARSAKAQAASELEVKLSAVRLDDGRTVADRVAKDTVFRADVAAFVASARTVATRRTEDGRYEVTLRLALERLYEFSRRSAAAAPVVVNP